MQHEAFGNRLGRSPSCLGINMSAVGSANGSWMIATRTKRLSSRAERVFVDGFEVHQLREWAVGVSRCL